MKYAGRFIVMMMAATFLWLAQSAGGFVQFLGYLWGGLLIISLALNWRSASKD